MRVRKSRPSKKFYVALAATRRERDLDRAIREAEAEHNAEIGALMAKGLSFEDAVVASGGLVIPDISAKAGQT